MPPQPEWSRPSFVYGANPIVYAPTSILLNRFFYPPNFRNDDPTGPFLDSHRPDELTELSSLLTLQTDSTIRAGSDLPQLPPEGGWGSQPTAEIVDDPPFIPPTSSNRSHSPPVVPTTQPDYPATQQTTPHYQHFNIDPRLYQVSPRPTLSPMVDSF